MGTMLVLTVTATDHPGIVDCLSRVVFEHGGNWLESRMVRLGGVFAGLVQIEVAAERAGKLTAGLSALCGSEMSVAICEAKADDPYRGWRRLGLELTGADHEGIVQGVTNFLAEQGVNVEDLTTGVGHAPHSGGPLFSARARLRCPPGRDVDELRASLFALASGLGVDVTLEDAGPAPFRPAS